MWTRNSDTGKWIAKRDELILSDYEFYKQELSQVKLYSKCLSVQHILR